jgi:hypothetical protein
MQAIHSNALTIQVGGKHMICPYCGGEMEFGNIVQREPVNWIPGNKPKTVFFNLDRAII